MIFTKNFQDKKIIKFYEKSSWLFINLEMLLVFGSLLLIIYGDIIIINNNINN